MKSSVENRKYGIVGRGRISRHLCHYFSLLGVTYDLWHRGTPGGPPDQVLKNCDVFLILISDSAIETFLIQNPELQKKTCVHFSGSLVTPLAKGVHPLMTFGNELYTLDIYRKITFVCDEGVEFQSIFPSLPNPFYSISPLKKAYYHSLCVLGGNFSTLLWQKVFDELERTLGIPKEAAFPYLEQMTKNLTQNSKGALTGPLQRRDFTTIQKNLKALENDPFQGVYRAFVKAAGLEDVS